jgi:hypothetical protein
MCFGSSNKRCDIFLAASEQRTAIDVAITHYAAVGAVAFAAASPGGAATRYEETVKERKYTDLATRNAVRFAPVVFDTMGAVGDSGFATLSTIARAWGRRFELPACRSIPIAMQRISSAFMKGIARLIHVNSMPADDATLSLAPTDAAGVGTARSVSSGPRPDPVANTNGLAAAFASPQTSVADGLVGDGLHVLGDPAAAAGAAVEPSLFAWSADVPMVNHWSAGDDGEAE